MISGRMICAARSPATWAMNSSMTDHTVRAILNHCDGTALGRYFFKSFDALTGPIQRYADCLWVLNGEPCHAPDHSRSSMPNSARMPTAIMALAPIVSVIDQMQEWPG